jgi:DNA-binding transcriptional LysR family regulator
MDIRDLEYFLACCKAESFTAAAREVHIVQSAMSCAIARLEQDLGASLFDRTVTPRALTEQGAALKAAAQRIIDAVQAAREEVAAVSGQVRGTVTLGSTLHTGRLDLACVLADIRERHPGVVVKLRQSKAGSEGLVQAVHDGSVDISLTASTNEPPRGIVLHPLFSEPMVFVCRPDHPLSLRPSVAVPDLREEMILRPPPGWGTRTVIDAALGATRSAFEVADYALMSRLVRARFATTLAPASAITGEMLAGLCAVPVDDARLRWTLSAAVCKDRRMAAAAAVVLDTLIRRSHACPQELATGGTAPRARPDLLFQADRVAWAQHPALEQGVPQRKTGEFLSLEPNLRHPRRGSPILTHGKAEVREFFLYRKLAPLTGYNDLSLRWSGM